MKYPALLPFADILPMLDDFSEIIDVRSPSEFAEDHIPGSINCPVLDDEERARVGTLYKQSGPFEAKKIGAALVARNIARHLEERFLDKARDWNPLVYCWRGGNRSGSMTHILAKIGWHAVQLDGGYKEYRRHVNTELNELPKRFQYRVICGTTGSGKRRWLPEGRKSSTSNNLLHIAARYSEICRVNRNRRRKPSKAASGRRCAISILSILSLSNPKAKRSVSYACRMS